MTGQKFILDAIKSVGELNMASNRLDRLEISLDVSENVYIEPSFS